MTVEIKLTSVGGDSTLFKLYSNVDGFTTPFATNIGVAVLLSGYTTSAVPDNTNIIRVRAVNGICANYIDILLATTTTTTTTLPAIICNESANSGGEGVTEFSIPLETEGGFLLIDFGAAAIPDKLEIIHNSVKVATTGMTTPNNGPFDNIYGAPTIPTITDTGLIDQFIGETKGTIPTRDVEFFNETGITILSQKQQLVWFVYDAQDVLEDPNALLRITGPDSTGWSFTRVCDPPVTTTTTSTTLEPTTTTTTTSSSSSTTTTSTTEISTTTTTTTKFPPATTTTSTTRAYPFFNQGMLSSVTEPGTNCTSVLDINCSIDSIEPNLLSVGDQIYNNASGTSPFVGAGPGVNYRIEIVVGSGNTFSTQIDAQGKTIAPVAYCN